MGRDAHDTGRATGAARTPIGAALGALCLAALSCSAAPRVEPKQSRAEETRGGARSAGFGSAEVESVRAERAVTVASVGEIRITDRDIAYRIAIEKAYGAKSFGRLQALMSLVNDALEMEMARQAGVSVTPAEAQALGRHADETSKAPATLARVKRVFGGDTASYERLYLAPKVANRKLREWYARERSVHRRERAAIEEAYALAAGGKPLEGAARACDLEYEAFECGPDGRVLDGAALPAPAGRGRAGLPWRTWQEVLDSAGSFKQEYTAEMDARIWNFRWNQGIRPGRGAGAIIPDFPDRGLFCAGDSVERRRGSRDGRAFGG